MFKRATIFCLLLSLPTFAATNPLAQKDGLVIRLVPENPDSALGAKTIEVHDLGEGVKLKWSGQFRELLPSTTWPSYRIRPLEGIIQTASLDGGLVHPNLWREGVINLDSASLIWAPAEITHHKTGEFNLDPGLLSPTLELLAKGLWEGGLHMESFRDQALLLMTPKNPETKNEKVENFLNALGKVQIRGETAFPVVIDGIKKEVPAVIAANNFIEYTILDFPENPLILKLAFNPETVLPVFKSFFEFFKSELEYRVTQIQTTN